MKIKTIDITAKEWFDKINGNSYFSARITVNYGLKNEKTFLIPFTYGYGDYYIQKAFEVLKEEKLIPEDVKSFWMYCNEKGIIKRTCKYENCLKRDLKYFTEN